MSTDRKERRTARLVLEDGSVFEGRLFGKHESVAGEVVFATGMVGYPESLTDPSYRGQILVLTYPLIGNYGVPERTESRPASAPFESDRIQVTALVVSDYSEEYSHWAAKTSLDSWLAKEGVPALTGVDTRRLTRRLREKGVMLGKVVVDKDLPFFDPNTKNLVAEVSCGKTVEHHERGPEDCAKEVRRSTTPTIAVLDCGVKQSIIRSLTARGAKVVQVPWDAPLSDLKFDGLLISNGPGDPKMCGKSVENIRRVMRRGVPILGICLGNQLLALAAGADTYKLTYGHRGQNQPCVNMDTGRCYITSQNHGYAVDERTLPPNWEPLYRNANDDTNEGIMHRTKPFIGVQFHPEASPGPVDAAFIFDEFLAAVSKLGC
ncbi:MAG: glutamine-hydrolyzing carbamoyl-phosphate synthase small subunit [Planctomycetota bacterium]|nr:glutamine-hydrolyzing carbamoyl-phosphate synthase small subunit [Planctomycetota bacterium]